MSRARTFTRAEMEDAVRLATEHGVTIRFERDGDMVIGPAALDSAGETSAESELEKWKARRGKTSGRAHH